MKDIAKPAAVWLAGASWAPSWKDVAGNDHVWDGKAYQDLLRMVGALPAGDRRDRALKNIGRLDCDGKDKTLASCNPDPSLSPPREAVDWRNALETAARISETDYAAALARVLRVLGCSGRDDAIYVVRGLGFRQRLQDADDAASSLIDDLMNKDGKDCPVAATLTDADRAKLPHIKKDAEKAGK